MNEKCRKIQEKIVENISDDDFIAHLRDCEDCKNFAKFAENIEFLMIEKSKSVQVPSHLDTKVKSAAINYLQADESILHFKALCKKIIPFAVAAGILIFSSLIFIYNSKDIEKTKTEKDVPDMLIAQDINVDAGSSNTEAENIDIEDEIFLLSADFMLYKEVLKYSLGIEGEPELNDRQVLLDESLI